MKKGFTIFSVIAVFAMISAGCKNNKVTTTKPSTTTKTTITTKNPTTKPIITTEDRTLEFKEIYVSTTGDEAVNGINNSEPTTLKHALEIMEMGDELFILEGSYEINEKLNIIVNGYQKKKCLIKGIGNVIFDFNNIGEGINIGASNIHIDNITVKNSKEYGFNSLGDNVLISNSISEANAYGGYKIDGMAKDNKISKSIARYNYSEGLSISGFYVSSSGTNNIIDECTAYRNQDNGFQIASKNKVVISNSLAYENGINKDGSVNTIDGDRSGFFFNLANHEFNNCISFGNQHSGFKSTGAILGNIPYSIINCSSINNRRYNYNMQSSTQTNSIFKNNLSFNNYDSNNDGICDAQSDTLSSSVTNSILYYQKEYFYVKSDTKFTISKLFSSESIDMGKYVGEAKYEINTILPEQMKIYDLDEIEEIKKYNEENGIEQTVEEIIELNNISYEIDFYLNDNLYLYNMLSRCESFQTVFFLSEEIESKTFFGAIINPFK